MRRGSVVSGVGAAVVKALASAATNASARAAGSGGKNVRARWRERRTRQQLDLPVAEAEAREIIASLNAEQLTELQSFVRSPEVEHLAFELATDRLLSTCGKKLERHRDGLL